MIDTFLALTLWAAGAAVVTMAAPVAFAQDATEEEEPDYLSDGFLGESSDDAAAPAAAASPEASSDSASATVPDSAWFRVDTDGLGTQLWFGAAHSLGGLTIASDIYLVGSEAELDIGPALTFGDLSLTPMIGAVFDFAAMDLVALVAPQLFTIYSKNDLYFESWIQVFIKSPFVDGSANQFYTRNFLLYKLNDWFQVGPEIDITMNLGESIDGAGDSGLISLPIGAIAGVDYGKNNKLLLFLGYDTQAPDGAGVIAGRFTFIRTW